MGSAGSEVAAAFDALDAAVEAILELDYDGVDPAARVGLDARLQRNLRRLPAAENQIIASLLEQTEPSRLGEASWPKVFSTALRITSADAQRRIARAKTLGPRRAMTGEPLPPLWQASAAAQRQGLLGEEHLVKIAKFHRKLPSWVDADTRAETDRHLARAGAGLDPDNLAKAAAMLLTMIDPDGPEPSEKERARHRGIVIGKQQPDGTATIRGRLTPEALAIWEAIFAKQAAPGANNPAADTPAADTPADTADADTRDGDPQSSAQGSATDTRTPAQRNHDAFLSVGRWALACGELGQHNGLPVTVIVSTTLQDLEKAAGVAVTGGGSLLPIPDLIRMAAPAHHYLYIYDKHTGQSLYLGRTKRLANTAQRIVLHARDRGCTRPGCTAPGYWCQAHHAVDDWTDGGLTDIDDLTMACGADHGMLDKTGWKTRKNTRNQTEWIPPPHLDTGQHRINGYHHPERYLLPDDDPPPEDEDDP
ncbi:HNH endonuclease [Mycobacterium sp. Y57]|uniref:HNH endonuclease signature motif containing protein n=1 Tax=Mycolicibacterium xanthum TaxID=2796469 RepID=UPI001C85DC5D|nr:HNH endonuclease signature motif containing protein [Mycolicibacterium xanthum]MBX7434682.1 HNH endonuclease [Mycolicibacterium xanthum]